MVNIYYLSKAKTGKKDLRGAKLRGADLSGLDLRKVDFRDADLRGVIFEGADLQGADFRKATFGRKVNFKNADLRGALFSNYGKYNTVWTNAKLEGAQGIILDSLYDNDYDNKVHRGDTVEEEDRKEEEREIIDTFKRTLAQVKEKTSPYQYCKKVKEVSKRYWTDIYTTDQRRGPSPSFAEEYNFTVQFWDEFRSIKEEAIKEAELLAKQDQEDRERERLERSNRARYVSDLEHDVSRAKRDKELESLALSIGALQAQPEYVEEHGEKLQSLQARIEEKYSVVGKGLRYLKRLFNKGRRASQIRTASKMINQINKEIADLKKDL